MDLPFALEALQRLTQHGIEEPGTNPLSDKQIRLLAGLGLEALQGTEALRAAIAALPDTNFTVDPWERVGELREFREQAIALAANE